MKNIIVDVIWKSNIVKKLHISFVETYRKWLKEFFLSIDKILDRNRLSRFSQK
jgi:hypothetical protein